MSTVLVSSKGQIVRAALTGTSEGSTAELKRLAAEIRALSAGRPQTPAEQLLRDSRSER